MSMDKVIWEEPGVYQMLQKADSIGVFQVESRAQSAMLPRLKPACYYDLVIQIAIVRPGPIQGDMVHPYLKRRHGLEQVEYPSKAVRQVLERTLGVPIFQEQVIQLAMVAAGFSGGEADTTVGDMIKYMVETLPAAEQTRDRPSSRASGFLEFGPDFAHRPRRFLPA